MHRIRSRSSQQADDTMLIGDIKRKLQELQHEERVKKGLNIDCKR